MDKNVKIGIMLLLVFFVLGAYLVLTLKEVTIKPKTPQSSEEYNRQVQENIKKIEEAYKLELKQTLAEFASLTSNPEKSSEEIGLGLLKIRDDLQKMTVPVQFKELHMSLFLEFSKAQDASADELSALTLKISNLITELKISYDWLA